MLELVNSCSWNAVKQTNVNLLESQSYKKVVFQMQENQMSVYEVFCDEICILTFGCIQLVCDVSSWIFFQVLINPLLTGVTDNDRRSND